MTTWTEEQEAIFTAFTSHEGNILESARAGSGKTTTNVEGAKRYALKNPGVEILAVAFNVKNKNDLEKKLKGSASVYTLNGLGHRAWGKATGRRLVLATGKVGDLCTEVVKAHERRSDWNNVRQLVSAAKTIGLVPDKAPHAPSAQFPDSIEVWTTLADHYDIDCDDGIIDMAREVLAKSIVQGFSGVIDFDDQIYLPVVYNSSFQKYDFVIGDEWQDLNPLNHIMIQRSCKMTGRVAAVGDEYQAIYGFRGADMEAMERFKLSQKATEFTLSVCWRCAESIIEHAQEIVPSIKPAPGAAKGKVSTLDKWDESIFQAGDAILCRNNAPTIALAFRLIQAGKGVHVLGRDLGKNLQNLVKKLTRERDVPIEFLLEELNRWEHREKLNAQAKGNENKIRQISDKADSLRAVIEFGNCKSIFEVNTRISQLFSRESAPITLSTIHKSKGLEFPRVFALDSHLLSPDWLTRAWAIQGDMNLAYVQRTRAISELTYIKSDEWS